VPRIPDDDEIFLAPANRLAAAIEMASIDPERQGHPVSAIVHTSIGHDRETIFLREHLTEEIESVAETAPDDHQICPLLQGRFGLFSISQEDVAKGAAGRRKPAHVALHGTIVTMGGVGVNLKTESAPEFLGLSDKLT
jgi:hypothetical protein